MWPRSVVTSDPHFAPHGVYTYFPPDVAQICQSPTLQGHRNGPKWKQTKKELGRQERSRKGIQPKTDFRLISVYLNFISGNGPKNIFQSVSFFLPLDSVLLLDQFPSDSQYFNIGLLTLFGQI